MKAGKRLYIFDMDGTLLPKTTASLEIARTTNTLAELHELERRFVEEKLSTLEFAKHIYSLWGFLDSKVLNEAFLNAPKLKRIKDTLSEIKQKGHLCCLITMSPDFFAERFYEYGFDYVFASQFPRTGIEAIDLEKILKPEDKPLLGHKLATQFGIDFESSVAFGDSMSDYPLFRRLQHTVAVNGTPELKEVSRHHYDGDDLYEAFLVTETAVSP